MKTNKTCYLFILRICIFFILTILNSNSIKAQDFIYEVCQGDTTKIENPCGDPLFWTVSFDDFENCFRTLSPSHDPYNYFYIWWGHQGKGSFKIDCVGQLTGIVWDTFMYEADINKCISTANCIEDFTITTLKNEIVYINYSDHHTHTEVFPTAKYSVMNNFITDGSIRIEKGFDYEFSAGNTIILNEGFVVEKGANFVAEIKDCTPFSVSKENNKTTINEQNIVINNDIKYNQPNNPVDTKNLIVKDNLDINIIPNPFNDFIKITIDLKNTTSNPWEIKVFDIYGKLVISKTIYSNIYMINTSVMPDGPYLLIIYYKGIIESKIIIKSTN